ncbi:MAG: hypothetical protein ACI4WT_10735 [Oligosphaeraceae bacterium]
MAETKYAVGLIANVDGFSTFLWQSNNLTVECDEYEAKDEKGNTKVVQHINHRVKGSVEAIVPLDTSLPVPGQTVTLKGVTLPTVDADGKVSGSLTLDSAASTTGVAFLVTGTPSVSQSNTDFVKCSFEVTRYLVNGLPGSAS